jgi:signal peptidase II
LKRLLISAITASAVILLDYITKRAVVKHIHLSETIPVLPFLRIVHIENKGAAFGIFSTIGNSVFIIVSIVAILLIVIYLFSLKRPIEVFSLSLILGGAIGNLIDRVMIGRVIDFIDVFVGEWHWPAFNVADSALTVGIVLFLISSLKKGQTG